MFMRYQWGRAVGHEYTHGSKPTSPEVAITSLFADAGLISPVESEQDPTCASGSGCFADADWDDEDLGYLHFEDNMIFSDHRDRDSDGEDEWDAED